MPATIPEAMRGRALALGVLLILSGCTAGEDGQRPQPFVARIVCTVERWLRADDYRRREPGSGLCDAKGLRIPRPELDTDGDPPVDPAEP